LIVEILTEIFGWFSQLPGWLQALMVFVVCVVIFGVLLLLLVAVEHFFVRAGLLDAGSNKCQRRATDMGGITGNAKRNPR